LCVTLASATALALRWPGLAWRRWRGALALWRRAVRCSIAAAAAGAGSADGWWSAACTGAATGGWGDSFGGVSSGSWTGRARSATCWWSARAAGGAAGGSGRYTAWWYWLLGGCTHL